ncbi:mycofactocin-coupled SDR family oxidoreductase [Pseudonocardia ailaonensis]|uniref:Mycofactocin-coupled SDR family oxidoreductase n=1 Tax=Pseudonocardia ailaonensis TaxID=367279 RepID=A0ABN2MWV4_9PSEU
MGKLTGKVAVITGAARGQGRSHALRLASEGADIIALDVCEDIASTSYTGSTADDLAETAAEIEKLDRRVVTAKADVRNYEQLDTAIGKGVSELGRLDIVCANAGILSMGQLHDLTEDSWLEMIDINLNGVWRTTKAATPHLIESGGGGSIIITASGAALHGVQNIGHYVAAKTGVIGLMRTLSIELAPHRIRANAISPTNVNSDMIQNDALYRLYLPHIENPTREQFAEAVSTTHPMGIPWVEPADVSAVVAFLASDESRYITGMQVPIMAGRDC